MRILFVNSRERQCGVHQYGENLCHVLSHAQRHQITYATFDSKEDFLRLVEIQDFHVIIYNWQAGIGGWMGEAPFGGLRAKQVLAYHDLEANFAKFDAILFSDPTMKQHDNWYPIGRPVRGRMHPPAVEFETPVIGINGFIGAWAANVVTQAVNQYERCHLRIHLPSATYGDAAGNLAEASKNQCKSMIRPGVTMEFAHQFFEWEDLIWWLSRNTINCYFRDESVNWRGVSSSLDAAMCAGRPIAINRCNAFRHFFDCDPSVLINDRPLREIVASGLAPLIKKHEEYSADRVAGQVFDVLERLI